MKQLLLLLTLLLVSLATFAQTYHSQPIDGTVYGSLIHVDGTGLFDVNLKGAPGNGNGRGLAMTSPPKLYSELPEGNACADFSPGPSGVLITDAEMTMTFKDGSMIWGADAVGGYVCFSGFAYAPYDLTGGYGRFEGATGSIVFELVTHGVSSSRLITPETGIAYGEIILP